MLSAQSFYKYPQTIFCMLPRWHCEDNLLFKEGESHDETIVSRSKKEAAEVVAQIILNTHSEVL